MVHNFEIKGVKFTLHGFNLTTPRLSHHKLVYAANRRGVLSDNLRDYIPNLSSRLNDEENGSFIYYGVLHSEYLTQKVNPARTDFDIGTGEDADIEQSSLFEQEITRAEIREKALGLIQSDLANAISAINKVKLEKIRDYVHADAPQYNVLMKYSSEFVDKIPSTPSKPEIEAALHRELHDREVKLKKDSSRIIKEAEKVDDYESYHQKLSQFMNSYNELGTAALAQYVMHRKILLEFLKQAISRDAVTSQYPLEELVHQLVFPMRSTSEDIPNHEQNLWILDERLAFHSFISSDKPLSGIQSRLDSTSKLRPDLLIFDEKIIFSDDKLDDHPINSIIVVEFKKPGRNDYSANEFVVDRRPVTVANDKIPATAYAVCDLTPTLRNALNEFDAFVTPDGQGYYGFQRTFGMYYEVISYDKLLRDAEKRNRIFFDKLNILGGLGKGDK
jgi:hypothetical protein